MKFNLSGTKFMEQEPKSIPSSENKKNVINIGLKGETETERLLSNFA